MMLGSIQWPMVSAIAASIGVIVALISYVVSLRITRLSNSAKMVLDFVNIFNSSEMKAHRSQFATMLLGDKSTIDLRRQAAVLEFFEEIGYMTRRKVLDTGMVWNSFSWWLEPYYLAVTAEPDLIAKARKESGSSSLYCETEWLQKKMCKVGMKEECKDEHVLASTAFVHIFLEDESKLAA